MVSKDLISTADKIMRMALKEGAEQAEVFLESRENLVMRITKVGGKDNFTSRDQVIVGSAIRVLKGGALGFAYLSNLEDESIRSSVRSALKVAEPQPGFDTFLGKPSGYPHVSGIFDKHTGEMDPKDVMSNLEAIRKNAKQVDEKRITVYDALFGRSKHSFAVVNSQGLNVDDEGSFARVAMGISAKESEKETKMEVYQVDRSVKDSGFVKNFASKYAGRVLKYLGTRKIGPKKMTAIFDPRAVAELFTYSFANAFCADNVQHKASPLEGKVGEQIASSVVTLIDDGSVEGGLVSFKMDDEGMPTTRTTLIEGGVLRGFLHSNQTANLASSKSTGNCSRWELPTVDYFYYRSYRRLPRVYPTNLIFKPGNISLETMVSEVEDGILIERTDPAFTARPDGSFSIVILNGLRIEGGKLTSPVSDLRIAGNIFDYAKKIDAVGNAPEKLTPQLYPACVIAPHIRIQDVNIQT